MEKLIAIAGIIFVMIGTIISVRSIIMINISVVGTCAGETGEEKKKFARQQKKDVFIGLLFIVAGSIMQCISVFMS